MEGKEKHLGEVLLTEFPSVRSKEARIISLQNFIDTLRSDRHRPAVESYRALRATPGSEARAQAVKNAMPCIIPAGVCRGGHRVSCLEQHSLLLCIDLDHTDSRTPAVLEAARRLPWVVALFVSISGEGVKLLARVREDDLADYEGLYHAVGRAVSRATGHAYDEKCKILTQPCFYSWDPDAYFNPCATPFVPSPEELTAAPVDEAEAVRTAFLDAFERRNPFRRGERNDIALKLGRAAAKSGFSAAETQKIVRLFARRYAASDFTEADIRQRVNSGFQYVAMLPPEAGKRVEGSLRVQNSFSPSQGVDDESNAEEVLDANNRLRAEAPLIPQKVYRDLPPFLQRCVLPAQNFRERDLLLLGSLNSCSVGLPEVTFYYKNATYSPHFYLATVAPAGAGKGIMAFTTQLLDATQDYYDELNRSRRRLYEEQMAEWEHEQAEARREHRRPTLTERPEEPKACRIKVSANTSKSRLIESLAAAGKLGCLAATTEINTLLTANLQDYGRYDDVLCKAAHHEEVSLSFKNSGDPIVARQPRLALNLTGTQEQFQGLFRSLEVGLYSRFAIYTREAGMEWESCAPGEDAIDLRQYFATLSTELLAMHRKLSPTLVVFGDNQWRRHTRFFSTTLRRVLANGNESTSGILFRHGLLAMRLAAVLTVLRKWEEFPTACEYRCTDADFDAALRITRVLLEHSLLLSSTLPATLRRPVKVKPFHKLEAVLKNLPRNFTFTQFVQMCIDCSFSESTGKRLLNKALEQKLVVKEGDGYRKRGRNAPNEGLKEK